MDSVKSTGRNAVVANQSTNLFIAEIGSNSANSKLSDHCGCLERSGLGTASAIYFEYIRYLWWVEVAGSLLQDISGIYPYIKNPFHWDFLESKLKSITHHQALTDTVESPKRHRKCSILGYFALRFTFFTYIQNWIFTSITGFPEILDTFGKGITSLKETLLLQPEKGVFGMGRVVHQKTCPPILGA